MVVARIIDTRPAVIRETMADRVRRLRLECDWTQAQLAERAYLSEQTVSRAERGHDIRIWALAALASALDTTMDYLFRDEATS